MAYSDFDLPSALKKLHIKHIVPALDLELYKQLSLEFNIQQEIVPSPVLQEELAFSLDMYQIAADYSEKMACTDFISPFLREVWKKYCKKLYVWQEMTLDADPEQGLTGAPDYCISKLSNEPTAPYFVIMEAKDEEKLRKKAWGQALAAMRGVQILNRKEAGLDISVYGGVSNGLFWQFGKLVTDQFIMYPEGYISIFDTDKPDRKILGILNMIFAQSEKIVSQS
jgi:hypothetical protein